MLSIIIGLTIGVGLPLQTAINSKLRGALASPFRSSLVSFTVGTLFLTVITLLLNHTLLISGTVIAGMPWWLWLGGFLGVIYLTGNIILFPRLGSVQTVIMPILGQIVMSMLIDNFGWFASPQHAFNWTRGLGSILVLGGVILAVAVSKGIEERRGTFAHEAEETEKQHSNPWPWRIAGILTGMLSATQTAINGHLGKVISSPVQAAFISFLIGMLTLLVIVLIKDHSFNLGGGLKAGQPWWIWIGGFLGALFVLGNIYLVPMVGTGMAVVIVLLGQIGGSLLVDQFGWLGSKRNPISLIQLVGLAVMLAGVVLIKVI